MTSLLRGLEFLQEMKGRDRSLRLYGKVHHKNLIKLYIAMSSQRIFSSILALERDALLTLACQNLIKNLIAKMEMIRDNVDV